jgi:Fe-S cluster biogenesis protein NfuA
MSETDKQLRERVAQVLAEEIGPALQMDGIEIEILDVEDGVARVRLPGACVTCPSTVMTMVMALEQELCRRIPEIKYLEAVP